ncbi:nucleic acid-binding, OB-fold protein [Tanacetum coccineum]
METTSTTDSKREEKGKMVLTEPEITNIADLSSTDSNKIIEAIVYRKWISKHYQTRQPTKFCCILLDKQGTQIQANMDVQDTQYFDQLLQLGRTYRISGFSCEKTPAWERTLQNETSFIFGRYLQAQNIPNDNFPLHYFNFAAYNELAGRENVRDTVLTDYIGHIRAVSGINTFGDATTQRKQRKIIDIENLRVRYAHIQLIAETSSHYRQFMLGFTIQRSLAVRNIGNPLLSKSKHTGNVSHKTTASAINEHDTISHHQQPTIR